MFKRKKVVESSTVSIEKNEVASMFSKLESLKNEPGLETKLADLIDGNPSKTLSFKEKLIRKRMMKVSAKMMLQGKPQDDNEIEDQSRLQELEQENKALSSRIQKLEAQNIIAAAQMVDFISIMIGLVTAITVYYVYARMIWWLADFEHKSSWIFRAIFLILPYTYNKVCYGVVYRRFQVFAVFVIFVTRIKMVRWRANKYASDGNGNNTSTLNRGSSNFGDGITEDDIWEANYEINARFLYSSILRLRGLWTKTAQYLSSRADFVPISYIRELSKLQDEAPETKWSDVQHMLEKAKILGHFSHVEKMPIASASIGQVHTAILKESRERVVIKVQHPHALTLLSDDFVSLRIMAFIIGLLEPEYKFFGILMEEWAKEAHKELDFYSEIANLESAKKSIEIMNLATPMMTNYSEKCFPFSIEIPIPIQALSSKQVMVMSFCKGKRIDDIHQIEKCNVPREAIMNALAQTFAHMMYCADIFNGDPHPGNIFIRPGLISNEKSTHQDETRGFTVVLLDWGLAKRLSESKRVGFCQLTHAAATFDFGLMMDAFKTLGLKLKREDVAEDMEGIRFILRDMAPRETARRRVKAKMKTDINRSKGKKKGERVPVDSNTYPGEFFFFVRTNELLQGLGSKLGVNMKFLESQKPFAQRGLKGFGKYTSVRKDPDPLLSETVVDNELNRKIETVLNDFQLSGRIAGAQVCVIRDGETLANNVKGNLGSLKSHLKLRSDAIILGFSVTKATATTLVHRMIEEDYLSLDEPICDRIWPEFCPSLSPPDELIIALGGDKELLTQKWQWKRSITLRHVLTHTTELWFATPANLTIKNLASCEECCKGFEYNPEKPENTILPLNEPGLKCTYQYLSFGWLVGGCVMGAYALRHGNKIPYANIYDQILGPLHSKTMKKAGFRPCGGGGDIHDMALVDTELDITRAMQMEREAKSMGEVTNVKEENVVNKGIAIKKEVLKGIKGREFVLDPRIWNSEDTMNANVPAAGGRFSAKALAMFYHELGNGQIISPSNLIQATAVCAKEDNLQGLQGQTTIANNSGMNGQSKSEFGLGYQIIRISDAKNSFAFGHAGVGGSIGFHHVSSNTSVGIMFNKVGGNQDSAKEIVKVISSHLNW